MTETSTLTAQEMADKIAELEGDNEQLSIKLEGAEAACKALHADKQELERQVLALRRALGNFASGYELNGAPLPLTRELEQAWDALADTAQAGRKAEAQVAAQALEAVADEMDLKINGLPAIGAVASSWIRARANRLRNGGPDSE